jgi:hypothetical protein
MKDTKYYLVYDDRFRNRLSVNEYKNEEMRNLAVEIFINGSISKYWSTYLKKLDILLSGAIITETVWVP